MIKEFTIAFSRTINLGNFSSARVEASVTMAVQNGRITEANHAQAQDELRNLLVETWKKQYTERMTDPNKETEHE